MPMNIYVTSPISTLHTTWSMSVQDGSESKNYASCKMFTNIKILLQKIIIIKDLGNTQWISLHRDLRDSTLSIQIATKVTLLLDGKFCIIYLF